MRDSILRCLFGFAGLVAVSGCDHHGEHGEHSEHLDHTIVTTSPQVKDVVVTQQYVCQIHSQKHIEVRAIESGYLEQIPVKEGQAVKEGQPLFRVMPMLFKARLDAEKAEVKLAELELANTKRLRDQKVVSENEVALFEAKLLKAKAKAKLAQTELRFTTVRAPFAGIIDRLNQQHGSLVKEGDILTTLSDNSQMWVYFNVPEAEYLSYMRADGRKPASSRLKLPDTRIELLLADGKPSAQSGGDTVTVEGQFNNETGNIAFRADIPNDSGLLRHGQTGNVVLHHMLRGALVIPQRATFEVLDKRYVFVVGKDGIVSRRRFEILHELEDVFIIKPATGKPGEGVEPTDVIVLEGVRQLNDGQKVEHPHHQPAETAMGNLKHAAE